MLVVPVHLQLPAIGPFWVVLSNTCSLSRNWAKYNVSNECGQLQQVLYLPPLAQALHGDFCIHFLVLPESSQMSTRLLPHLPQTHAQIVLSYCGLA